MVEGLEDGKYRDLGLSDEGVSQSERLRDRLTQTREIKPDVFIASSARRAQETARILAPAFEQPLLTDAEFEEWRTDDGSLSPEAFMERWNQVAPDQRAYIHWVEGGENRLEFTARVHFALNRVTQAHAEKTVAIVTHGAFIQTAFSFFFGYGEASFASAAPEIRHASITHWYKQQNRWILERSNDYHHLL
jgi:probable phosphoglycerate mutase